MRYYLLIARLMLVGVGMAIVLIILSPFGYWGIPDKLYDKVYPVLSRWSRQLMSMRTDREIERWTKNGQA